MSKSPRKSIVANFSLLSASLESDQLARNGLQAPSVTASSTRVPAGVIGATQRSIGDIRSERDRLKALVEAGGAAVREIEPSLIDPSPYPDRLPDDDPSEFESFKRSIEQDGQKVPIQVRKNVASPGRYQVVYGHRRWLAAKQLSILVRAIEVEISDLDLVVAQGIENASRQDLTWIERALFASRMDNAGIKARDIYASLAIEDAELARMRGVYRSIPADVIEAIGRAPRVGRPRWLDLARALSGESGALNIARDVLSGKGDVNEGSDKRFQRVLNAIKPVASDRNVRVTIADGGGKKLGSCVVSAKEVRIAGEGSLGFEFLKFVEAELPGLAERFTVEKSSKKT